MAKPIGYSYVRFSSKKQGKGSSLHRQTEDTVAGESPASWCERNGVTLDTTLTFRDLGVSAYTGRNSKHGELRAFLDAVATGRIRPGSYLLVERVDRITRQGVDEGMDLIKQILRAGVHIVTLANGRVYGPTAVKGLMKGLLELQMYLEQAQQFSETLSARVGAAWEQKRKRARSGKTLTTAKMPPWLDAVGEGDGRRAVLNPERAAVVRRIFNLTIAGHGTKAIIDVLNADGVRPFGTSGQWSRTTIRRYLSDRAAIGEYQPTVGSPGDRKPDGPPIQGYYPAVVELATFHKARASAGGRAPSPPKEKSSFFNVFSGLLKNARDGASYYAALRVERGGRRYHVILSGASLEGRSKGAFAFSFPVFEEAVLSLLKEINPRDLLPPDLEADNVLALSGELVAVESKIAELEAELLNGEVAAIARTLRALEKRKKELADELAEARQRAAAPLSESWGEAGSLLAAIDAAPDRGAAKVRLRATLRRIIESIWVLVVPRNRDRLAAVQVRFNGVEQTRDYVILHVTPKANANSSKPGGWWARSISRVAQAGHLDLRQPAHVGRLAAVLETIDLDEVTRGEGEQ